MKSKQKIKNLILDVDGVLTTGQFLYSKAGKSFKVFGPDDSDVLNIVKNKLHVHMITGDKRGFDISAKRIIDDMKFPLDLVSTYDRVKWIKDKYGLQETVYMGDGVLDLLVFQAVGYSIAPANAFPATKRAANFVTHSRGGEGAVAEACFHLMSKFFKPIKITTMKFEKGVGIWK